MGADGGDATGPTVGSDDADRLKFAALCIQCEGATRFLSSITDIVGHPAYQRIIEMGPAALPFIFERLRAGDLFQWWWALEAITQANPVLPENYGDMEKMAAAWLDWADRQK